MTTEAPFTPTYVLPTSFSSVVPSSINSSIVSYSSFVNESK